MGEKVDMRVPTRMEREFGEMQRRRSEAFLRFTQRPGMPMTYGAGKEPVLKDKAIPPGDRIDLSKG